MRNEEKIDHAIVILYIPKDSATVQRLTPFVTNC